jgi:dolichol-phosphate mannosyltransferase
VLIIAYILFAWASGRSVQGWTSILLVVVVLGAAQMFVLAMIGEYIGRLYSQAKQRPLYIVEGIAGGSGPERSGRLGQVALAPLSSAGAAEAMANKDSPGGSGTRPSK